MAIQWHPLFAELLRPLLEAYYEVLTNVPVGDVPREADLLVLRRTSARILPFHGLWRHLKTWNALEYKGRSVSARIIDIDLLVELGLGIHRRLNEQRAKNKQAAVPASEMCFWYVASRLARRFLNNASTKLGTLESVEEGVWRGHALGREVILISGTDVKLEIDTLPFFVLSQEKLERQSAVPRLLMQNERLINLYSSYLEIFHHEVFKELETMARIAGKKFEVDLRPAVERYGLHRLIEQFGIERILTEAGQKQVIEGLARVIDETGKKLLLAQLLDDLSPQERAKLKRRFEQE